MAGTGKKTSGKVDKGGASIKKKVKRQKKGVRTVTK